MLTLFFWATNTVWTNLIRMDAAYADKELGFSLDNN